MGEIVGLQLGHYSNFIGAHRWNIQESQFYGAPLSKATQEINRRCTFREGKTNHGVETYTPRLIAVDLQGSIASLKHEGALHNDDSLTKVENQLWDGVVEVCKEECTQPRDTIDTWSDCLTTKLHLNSFVTLPGYWHNDLVQPFDCYSAGIEAAQNMKFAEEIDDRLHFFTEECDHLQGFQLLANMQDGFGGVASEICAHMLHEQFPKKAIWFNGVIPPSSHALQIVSLSCCLPLPLVANSNLTTSLAGRSVSDHFTSLLPEAVVDKNTIHWSQQTVLRGIPADYPLVPPKTMPSSLSSLLNTHDRTMTTYQLIQNPLIIPKSFPKLFSPQLTAAGLISPDGCRADVRSLPMGTSLQSNSSIHGCLTSLLTAVKNINIKRYPVFSTTCLDCDGWTQLQQSLHDLADCYVTSSACGDWSSDSD